MGGEFTHCLKLPHAFLLISSIGSFRAFIYLFGFYYTKGNARPDGDVDIEFFSLTSTGTRSETSAVPTLTSRARREEGRSFRVPGSRPRLIPLW